LTFAFAVINALVVAKVIMIGEYANVGRRFESKPLILSTMWKALLFVLLVFGFHIAEEVIKHLLHGRNLSGAYHDIHMDDLLGRSLLVFCTFVTLFGFRELRRTLGHKKFQALLFRSERSGQSETPSQH
jgi:hypothetical protein